MIRVNFTEAAYRFATSAVTGSCIRQAGFQGARSSTSSTFPAVRGGSTGRDDSPGGRAFPQETGAKNAAAASAGASGRYFIGPPIRPDAAAGRPLRPRGRE